jgi:hypothetical protein
MALIVLRIIRFSVVEESEVKSRWSSRTLGKLRAGGFE